MVFSDVANGAGLVQDVHWLCGTDSVSYPTADIARNMNRHYNKAVIDVLKTEGRLQFDDSTNLNSLPEYTFTLVNGQKQYSLPTNLLKMWGIEVTDSAGNITRLTEIDIQDPLMARTISDFEETAGVPRFYDIRGENVFLYPAPATAQVTLIAGGKMYFAREVDPFTAADTTQEPAIPEPFQRILSLGTSYDWQMVNDTKQKADGTLGQYEQLRAELRAFSASRNKDTETRLRPLHNQHDYI